MKKYQWTLFIGILLLGSQGCFADDQSCYGPVTCSDAQTHSDVGKLSGGRDYLWSNKHGGVFTPEGVTTFNGHVGVIECEVFSACKDHKCLVYVQVQCPGGPTPAPMPALPPQKPISTEICAQQDLPTDDVNNDHTQTICHTSCLAVGLAWAMEAGNAKLNTGRKCEPDNPKNTNGSMCVCRKPLGTIT